MLLRALGPAGLLLGLLPKLQAQTLTTRTFTPDNGLLQSMVYCLGQDAWGRLWVGSQAGASVYNGQEFKVYGGSQGLPDSHVRAVAPVVGGTGMWVGMQYASLAVLGNDQRIRQVRVPGLQAPGNILSLWAGPGELWMGTQKQGVWRLRFGASRADTLVQHWSAVGGHAADSVEYLGPGLRGQLWASSPHGLLVFDGRSGQPLPAAQAALPPALRQRTYGFCRVSDSVAWVGTRAGLLRVSAPAGGRPWRLRHYTAAEGLSSNLVLRVAVDWQGRVWANAYNGLNLGTADPSTGQLHFRVLGTRPNSASDHGHDVLLDREGNIWAADGQGVTQYLTNVRFTQYGPADGLRGSYVCALAQPRPDELWLAMERHLTALPLTATGIRTPTRHLLVPAAKGTAGANPASLLADRQGRMWVGTFRDGLRRYDMRTGRWENLNNRAPALAGVTVSSIGEDARGRLWLTTHRMGVTVYDPATDTYRTFRKGEQGLPSDNFWQVFRDHRGWLWLGSDDAGLVRVDTDHDTFERVDGQSGRLCISSISEDEHGDFWLGPVGIALLRYEPATRRLLRYDHSGLQSINPYFVQCDGAGQVWVGTHLGVDVLNMRTGKARSFDRTNGYGGGETNENAVLRGPDGRLWMGTVGGLMVYDPRRPARPCVGPSAYLTGLRVGLHDTTIAAPLELPYRLNSVSFDYIGVSLARPGSVRYQYRLRGYRDEWVGPVTSTSATYASLPPGHYAFEVRASTDEGGWSPQPARLSFDIAAPWWRRWWAFGLYAAAFGLALAGVRRRTRAQERERAERALERQTLRYLQELDRVKTDFFTNVSHELRTPLTLILGPAEVLAETVPDPASRRQAGLVLGQARKLLQLINQLLDLSKLDAGALRLHPTAGDVARLARQLVTGFAGLAERRGIGLHLEAPDSPVLLVFDAAKLDEVLTNLLANALRFTPEGGQVWLRVAEQPPTAAAPAGTVELAVQDTGPGIAAEDLPNVFDRFYQARSQEPTPVATRQGTGIGLALVRELVALHGGTVTVSSLPGEGACFVVRLPRVLLPTGTGAPYGGTAPAAEPMRTEEEMPAAEMHLAGAAAATPATAATNAAAYAEPAEPAQVLIIEDSEEVRAFVAETLAGYRLLLAPDGAAGLDLARAEVPDLIVSDVMMPGLSGYEVCAALKADAATSHIPVVLLTARTTADDRLQGLETGAQAYLPKPFRPRELQAQVRSLLHLREQTQARFAGTVTGHVTAEAAEVLPYSMPPVPPPADPLVAHQAAVAALPSRDQAFLRAFEAAILAHLGDEHYSMDQLGAELNLSRTQLYRKLKALTGQAPAEYLRQTRLLRALALLQGRVATVAEVAYQVGYANPAHFSTAFSRHFGYPPSAVCKEMAQKPV
ncbi:ATP-binding protein [Hymenobacter monticola]|uniref:histidine kinase n=1 Tax=Hymenobacter monticola TaxID=1705399 RepID=A0ABY4B2G4_9BACT|nr:ATP-binding protein [Hymenobacter monticola]UOE33335.1 ATP-binding protein [Hymenobacter monticola]